MRKTLSFEVDLVLIFALFQYYALPGLPTAHGQLASWPAAAGTQRFPPRNNPASPWEGPPRTPRAEPLLEEEFYMAFT